MKYVALYLLPALANFIGSVLSHSFNVRGRYDQQMCDLVTQIYIF